MFFSFDLWNYEQNLESMLEVSPQSPRPHSAFSAITPFLYGENFTQVQSRYPGKPPYLSAESPLP